MKERKWFYHLILLLVGFILLFPVAVLLINSFSKSWIELVPEEFVYLDYWKSLVTENPEFWASVLRSVSIAVFPILLSGVCLVMAMYAAILYFPWLDAVIQAISMIPYTLRGVVLSISVLTLYAGVINRMVMLVCVYCVVILPFMYRGIRNNLYAINVRQLIEAAELLGAGGLYTFFRIIVPNMLSGILVSSLLAFGSIFTDYAVIKIIAGSRYMTAQAEINQMQHDGSPLTSAALIAMFAMTMMISVVSYSVQNRGKKQA